MHHFPEYRMAASASISRRPSYESPKRLPPAHRAVGTPTRRPSLETEMHPYPAYRAMGTQPAAAESQMHHFPVYAGAKSTSSASSVSPDCRGDHFPADVVSSSSPQASRHTSRPLSFTGTAALCELAPPVSTVAVSSPLSLVASTITGGESTSRDSLRWTHQGQTSALSIQLPVCLPVLQWMMLYTFGRLTA